MERICQKTPLIEPPAPFLGVSFTLLQEVVSTGHRDGERGDGVVVVAERCQCRVAVKGITVVLGSNEHDLSQISSIC